MIAHDQGVDDAQIDGDEQSALKRNVTLCQINSKKEML